MIENLFKMEPWLQILIPLAVIFICGFCACCALWDNRREIERERREEAEKQANNLELGPINSGTIAFFLKFVKFFIFHKFVIFVGICLIILYCILYDFCCVDDGVEEETQADNLELGLFNNSGAYIFFNTTG